VLLFDEDRQAMSLGNTVEEEENAATQSKERSTAQRIEKEIWDTLCVEPNITQGDLLKAVTGKNTAKLKILQEMVDTGKGNTRARRQSHALPCRGASGKAGSMTTIQEVKARGEERAAILSQWHELIPSWTPAASQCDVWLERHAFATVIYAVRETAKKNLKMNGQMTPDHLTRFASKVMNSHVDRQKQLLVAA